MSLRPNVSTPQPFRDDTPRDRSNYETELWDDYANVVFFDSRVPNVTYHANETHIGSPTEPNLCYLEIPCPVVTRMEFSAYVQLASGAGTANVIFGISCLTGTLPSQLNILGPQVIQTFTGVASYFPISYSAAFDVPPGVTELAMVVIIGAGSPNIGMYSNTLTIRRGRIP